jgi:hypothetical protein
MIRFADTSSMTRQVLKQNPSIILYPLFALLVAYGAQACAALLASTQNPFFSGIAILLLGVGILVGLTAFTYPIFRSGYAVAKELGRPTHLNWNSWSAAFGLAIPWVAAVFVHLLTAFLLSFCFVFPTVIYLILLWPIFPLIFGPRFDVKTCFSLTKQLISKATSWVIGLGFLIFAILVGAFLVLQGMLPALNIFLVIQDHKEAIMATNMIISISLTYIVILAFLYPTIVALMLADDVYEPCFNVKTPTVPERPIDIYDENAATVALAAISVSPQNAAKIQQLADLRAKGILSEEEFIRERAALRH